MKRFRSINDYSIDDLLIYELVNNKPSMTVPDQSMTINEILALYQRGECVDGKSPSFDVPEDVSDSDAFAIFEDDDNPDMLTKVEDSFNKIKEDEEVKRNEEYRRRSEASRKSQDTVSETVKDVVS